MNSVLTARPHPPQGPGSEEESGRLHLPPSGQAPCSRARGGSVDTSELRSLNEERDEGSCTARQRSAGF